MTDSRRDFLKKAALLSGSGLLGNVLPPSIARAMAIDPEKGSTYLDAEHIVILMQENRSFDHSYGSLKGVRGFNDPRAIRLPNGNPVWAQQDEKGAAYLPFRLNMRDTKATWMSSLPHSWPDQVEARNQGRYDQWLTAKRSGNPDYAQLPLTLGFYNRDDIPFYYAFADAFTVCDQSFCSSLTGTTPNRLYLWSGTIREKQEPDSYANVLNHHVDYGREASWPTFPERLEDNGISWKIYQNEISLPVGLPGEAESWLANFTDNPLEWMKQYKVRFSPAHQQYLQQQIAVLPAEIAALEKAMQSLTSGSPEYTKAAEQLREKRQALETARKHIDLYSRENFDKLPEREKNLHSKAFTTNTSDPDYHNLDSIPHTVDGQEKNIHVPKGDIFHQFRSDVNEGRLPTVSWLVAPEKFSDHPSAPWYGAWYVSQALDILTHHPEVWKKTIFILCYDENDGYFDHVPPFVVPTPGEAEAGLVSKGIDTAVEYVTREQDAREGGDRAFKDSPIGLGYRVPLVVASPWSRGGAVCSQVCDLTSILMFLEKFLTAKTGKEIRETNISAWRRTICGDLTAVFKPFNGEPVPLPQVVERNELIKTIYDAKNKMLPAGFRALSETEISSLKQGAAFSPLMPAQERGTRPARPIPYELYADMQLLPEGQELVLTLKAGNVLFGKNAAGAPFTVYMLSAYKGKAFSIRNYAVAAGDTLRDTWSLAGFSEGQYHIHVHGPNGFFREFKGDAGKPALQVSCSYGLEKGTRSTGKLELTITNHSAAATQLFLKDNAYKKAPRTIKLGKKGTPQATASLSVDLSESSHWYDLSLLHVSGWLYRYAGHVETGKESETDPFMGGKV
ncbi:MAG: phospholipase C, phosphocholine-specific [Candidatus Pseudobacter hemicellulosilyticus]|uniref:phospholipase C n=1 Tax=Candidatus Pseudobacter hemicellulosilyticus TaxID=3121375 RepID=A0AAJ6BHG0_9BACT|nr:MAG: phospholipase C, phosphocholine-specific [Pseudobacter sp.]